MSSSIVEDRSRCYLRISSSLTTYPCTHRVTETEERIQEYLIRSNPPNFVTQPSTKVKRAVTNRLWRYRKALELSQKQAAQILGHKSTAQVSRWENGEKSPTLDNVLMLACILKAPVEALFADRAAELQLRIKARTSKMRELAQLIDHDNDTRSQAA